MMYKTIKNPLALAFFLLCLLALGACSPDADPEENTEDVLITNLPGQVGDGGKTPFKVYVQLSEGRDASAGYVAKGEKVLDSSEIETAEVRITLKDPDGNDWTGSDFNNVCVLISPETVDTMADIDAKPQAGVISSKTLVLDWEQLMEERFINTIDEYSLAKLYNGIVVDDGEISGDKTPAFVPTEDSD